MNHSTWKKVKQLFRIVILCLVVGFALHTVVIVMDGLRDELTNVDVAVVLGNKVEVDGTPSDRLQARLDKAAELYKEGYFNTVIVSGGVGKEGFDEARVMKGYLVKRGIAADEIIIDSNGYNTYMTAQNSKSIMDDLGFDSAMVITQYFHITRTELAFHKVGVEKVHSAHAEIAEFRDAYSIIREFPAYYQYLILK